MENVISFTPAQLVAFITAIGGAIVTIGAVATLIFKLVNRIKAPEVEQNRRIKVVFVPPFSYKNNVPCQIWNT